MAFLAARRLALQRSTLSALTRPTLVAQTRLASSLTTTSPLEGLETRWSKLPECEQGAIADRLYEKEKGDWRNMTLEEKRAAYFIAYGPYGARTPRDPSTHYRVAGWTTFFVLMSFGMWHYWFTYVTPKLPTTTPEWQEATVQRSIEQKQNPFTGAYSKVRKAAEAEEAKE
ncbi:Cytochrome c oxidase subunit 5A [Quaeritorhiza haematococci]|nr:Cytochrome c oxidase subunit 5A [Quaeritorhiza haematococci]